MLLAKAQDGWQDNCSEAALENGSYSQGMVRIIGYPGVGGKTMSALHTLNLVRSDSWCYSPINLSLLVEDL